MQQGRARASITRGHLRLLADVARRAREEFFERRLGARIYRNRFIAAALCQGAALHYLHLGSGVKDFDIHLFYVQHSKRKQVARSVRRISTEIPRFGLRKVDIIHTVIPKEFARNRNSPVATIRSFLRGQANEDRNIPRAEASHRARAGKHLWSCHLAAIPITCQIWIGLHTGGVNSTDRSSKRRGSSIGHIRFATCLWLRHRLPKSDSSISRTPRGLTTCIWKR